MIGVAGRQTQSVIELLDHKKHFLPFLPRIPHVDAFGTSASTIPAVRLTSIAAHLSLTTINTCSVSGGPTHDGSIRDICLNATGSKTKDCGDYLLLDRALLVLLSRGQNRSY